MKWVGLLLILCTHALLGATPLLQPEQRLGAALPMDAVFLDRDARPVRLANYFAGEPVILVLGYYQCPMLCSTVMDGILQSLADIDDAYQVVAISIDPAEQPATAARKFQAYASLIDDSRAARLHLLTGPADSIVRVTQRAGFSYEFDAASGQYSHPAGFMVATPEGRISRYFPGVRFDSRDLRLALVEASSGRIGSLAERFVLMCSHYDPATGRYSVAVMRLVRVAALIIAIALLAGIGIAVARQRRRT